MANAFTNRIVQHPGRVTMTPVSGQSDTYDVSRAEGTVTQAGTPFDASTFNGVVDEYGMFYGSCSSSADALAKVVTCPGFALENGASIAVYFENGQEAADENCSLNVNGTGAYTISPELTGDEWEAGDVKVFVYTGSSWNIVSPTLITDAELTALETALGI